jgi:DNA-binding IclR family transcriptional regulator
VDDAADMLDISRRTSYRYFSSLCGAGLLDPTFGGQYTLGPAIIAYDRQLRLQDPLLQVARPVMERLVARNRGEGIALLCRRFRQEVMCVDQVFMNKLDLAVGYERGRPMGLFRGAASLVILANLPWRTLRRVWLDSGGEMAAAGRGDTWEDVRNSLKEIRAAGVSVTYGEVDEGVVGIASAIWHADQRLAGSVGLVISAFSGSSTEVARISALVDAAGREISAGLLMMERTVERP